MVAVSSKRRNQGEETRVGALRGDKFVSASASTFAHHLHHRHHRHHHLSEVQPKPLPIEFLDDLRSLHLYYPGYHRDYAAAAQAFRAGSEANFQKAFRKLQDKQRVYEDYRSFTRLNQLAALELAYPGHEQDKQDLEQWHLSHPPDDDTDAVFRDKLEGLRNKDALFFGDRSHPNVVVLDELVLTYPDWQSDFQETIKVHCDQPAGLFPDRLHMLREKQRIHQGDRTHWRLVQLDKLKLTYPGWENDVAQVEVWHLHHGDTPKNTKLFAEVVEGMRDQQIIFLGWDGVGEDDDEEDKGGVNHVGQLLDSMSVTGSSVADAGGVAAGANPTPGDYKRTPRSSIRSSYSSFSSNSDKSHDSDTAQHRTGPPASTESLTNVGTNASSSSLNKKPINLGKCVVCLTRTKTHVFVPCGHLCACAACGTQSMETGALCPICRSDADNVYRVFLT